MEKLAEKILDKVSTYDIFNNIFPGIVFSYFLEIFSDISVETGLWYKDIFIFYFIGMILSRIGSLVIESFLIKFKIIKYAPYADFIDASSKDNKIELFTMLNNMYRTLTATFFILLLFNSFEKLEIVFVFLKNNKNITFNFFLLILFVFSFKKQTDFIRKRVEKQKTN